MFLYVRMFFTLVVSLYTSRIILEYLGVNDFGIYNLVGGVVVLFSFLNSALTSATQRFINYEIANKENSNSVNKVFCISINIHFILSILILLLGETIGLWFLNSKLNIPESRMYAANFVYQISLFTTVFNVLRVPYNALIIAYEKMSFYALLGIVETLGKLLIVFLLVLFLYDRLIVYSVLLAILTLVVSSFYYFYCYKNYREQTKYRYINDKKTFKEITSFSGWSLFGNTALMASNQGVNFILNMFFGVIINATMGIANQVNAAVYSFVSNFQVAFMPQITQSYAENNIGKHEKLVLQASKFSFFLLLIISTPLLVNTEFVLEIWLGKFPEYSIQFTKLIIVFSLIDALSGSFWMSAHAIGNIKKYQLWVAFFLILNLPLAYLLLAKGYSPISVMVVKVVLNLMTYFYRVAYIFKKIKLDKKPIYSYLGAIFIVILMSVLTIYLVSFVPKMDSDFLNVLLNTAFVLTAMILIIYFFGMDKSERFYVKNQFNSVLNKINA